MESINMDLNNKINQSKKKNEKYQDTFDLGVNTFVGNVQSEYSIFGLLFQEIAQIRIEIDRLGLMVRLNTSDSPNYLKPYLAHIKTLLLIVNPVIPFTTYEKIEKFYNKIDEEITKYNNLRKSVPNKMIDNQLIKKLDLLCRVVYLYMNNANLGIKTVQSSDLDTQIEKSIVGD